jgi:hypothetical protein
LLDQERCPFEPYQGSGCGMVIQTINRQRIDVLFESYELVPRTGNFAAGTASLEREKPIQPSLKSSTHPLIV